MHDFKWLLDIELGNYSMLSDYRDIVSRAIIAVTQPIDSEEQKKQYANLIQIIIELNLIIQKINFLMLSKFEDEKKIEIEEQSLKDSKISASQLQSVIDSLNLLVLQAVQRTLVILAMQNSFHDHNEVKIKNFLIAAAIMNFMKNILDPSDPSFFAEAIGREIKLNDVLRHVGQFISDRAENGNFDISNFKEEFENGIEDYAKTSVPEYESLSQELKLSFIEQLKERASVVYDNHKNEIHELSMQIKEISSGKPLEKVIESLPQPVINIFSEKFLPKFEAAASTSRISKQFQALSNADHSKINKAVEMKNPPPFISPKIIRRSRNFYENNINNVNKGNEPSAPPYDLAMKNDNKDNKSNNDNKGNEPSAPSYSLDMNNDEYKIFNPSAPNLPEENKNDDSENKDEPPPPSYKK